MAFATIADFETYLRRQLVGDQAATAEMVLDIATATIRRATGQTLSLVEGDTYSRRTSRNVVDLPQRPVRAVSAVTIDGIAQPITTYEWDGVETVTLLGPLPVANGPTWARSSRLVTITYDHGYPEAEVPWDIKGICLNLAARAFSIPPGVTQTSLGSFNESYVRQVAGTLMPEEQAALRPYRRGQATATAGLGR